jgi:hypothetical protein
MFWEALQNLGIFATGTAAAGLVVRYGTQRFSGLIEQGIERSSEAVEQGIERFSEVVEQGIEQFFEMKVAQHQADLEAHRAASSRLRKKRTNTVIELYQRFVQFERDMRSLKTGMSSDADADQLLRTATESGNAFSTYYMENKIYFPPDTCDAIESVRDGMTDTLDSFRAGTPHSGRPEQQADVDRRLTEQQGVTGDKMSERKYELETHFRELLGVDPDGKE